MTNFHVWVFWFCSFKCGWSLDLETTVFQTFPCPKHFHTFPKVVSPYPLVYLLFIGTNTETNLTLNT